MSLPCQSEDPKMTPHLLDLPRELLNSVLLECDPSDLGKLSRSCKDMNHYIKSNTLLHKEIYLLNWDKSRYIKDEIGPHWTKQVQRNVRLLKLLEANSSEVKRNNFEFISQTLVEFLQHANESLEEESVNVATLALVFEEEPINQEVLLCQSSLFSRIRSGQRLRSQDTVGQMSANLHCLYGVPMAYDPATFDTDFKLEVRTYPYAISKVYDLRNYTTGTMWGPFLDDGQQRVDWEMVEALMIVLGHNLRRSRECTLLCRNLWKSTFRGVSPHSYLSEESGRRMISFPQGSLSLPLSLDSDLDPLDPDFEDPYNISGMWMRIVCFLDYRDLFEYNFARSRPKEEPLAPYSSEEATRMIVMQLQATGYGEHGPNDDTSQPVVTFVGSTYPIHAAWDSNAHASMKGTVRTTAEGEIRWTSFSIYHGEERWRSEGIQVGGIDSARGVIGTWFDKDYDVHGPAGPTAFWKIDDVKEQKDKNDEDDLLEGLPAVSVPN